MRARGRDIVELFGFRPDDLSAEARRAFASGHCKFSDAPCSKTNHDQTVVYGVCSVTNGIRSGPHNEVIICPKRLYANQCEIFQELAVEVWGDQTKLVFGGDVAALRNRALLHPHPAVAFGQSSGTEIAVNSNGQMSMDWVIQKYTNDGRLHPVEFIGIEVQSIDTTGNYRDNWKTYERLKNTGVATNAPTPDSAHGLNWANVHKRLIPQIIRKGNIYRASAMCAGFYFVVPEIVYQKFEDVIGDLPELDGPGRDRLSIRTYSLGAQAPDGFTRQTQLVRTVHYDLLAIGQAFISNTDENASGRLDARMRTIL